MLICPKGQIPALCLPRGRVGGRHSQGQRSHADSCPQPRAHFSVSFPPPRANTLVGAGGGTQAPWKSGNLSVLGSGGTGALGGVVLILPSSLRLRDRQRTGRRGLGQQTLPAIKVERGAEGEQREAKEERKGGERGKRLSAWPPPPKRGPCLAPLRPSVNREGSAQHPGGGGGQ